MSERLNININDETAAFLQARAAADEASVTEVVRRAVSVYAFYRKAQAKGKRMQTEDKRGRVMEVEFLV